MRGACARERSTKGPTMPAARVRKMAATEKRLDRWMEST